MRFDRCTMYKCHISSPIEFVPLRSSYTSRIQVQHILNYIKPRVTYNLSTLHRHPLKLFMWFPSYQKMSEEFGTSYANICLFPIPPYTAPGLVVWEVRVTRFSLKPRGRWEAPGELEGVVLHTSMAVEAHRFLKQFCCWCSGGVPHITGWGFISVKLDDFKIQNFQIGFISPFLHFWAQSCYSFPPKKKHLT